MTVVESHSNDRDQVQNEESTEDGPYQISKNCVETLCNLEQEVGNNSNGMPLLVEILRIVKNIENKVNTLTEEINCIKSENKDKTTSNAINPQSSKPISLKKSNICDDLQLPLIRKKPQKLLRMKLLH